MKAAIPLAALALFGAASHPAPAAYPDVVLADGPVAYFRFDEDAAAGFAADSSGNGNDAADFDALGTGEIGVQGAIGNAIDFNGDGAVVTGLTLDPSAGDFSIEAIIRQDGTTVDTQVVVSNQDGGGLGRSNLTLLSDVPANTGTPGSFTGGATTNSGIATEIGEWQHVVLTYESLTGTIRMFVDGVEGNQGFVTAESAAGNWVIGAHKSATIQFTDGIVDEVAIYDKRLDDPDGDGDPADSRIGAHYAAYLDDTGLFQFYASEVQIFAGESVTLLWECSPTVTAMSIDQGVGDVLANTEGNPGERFFGDVLVSPTETTTYTLTGTTPFETDTLSVTVVVDPPPVIDAFAVTPDRIGSGGTVEFSWAIRNATSAEIDGGVGAVDPVAGTASATVNGDTTFTLTATGPGGTVTSEVMVDADPLPVITAFAASSTEVGAGGSVQLSWTLLDATSATIDNGVGDIDPLTGAASVTVNADTTFTLTATNANGSVAAEVTVTTFAVAEPNLVAHWRVGEMPGETDGTTLLPEFGSTLDGTFVGSPTWDTADPAPVPDGSTASLSFPGDGLSWVDVLGWGGIAGAGPRTVAFWFKGPGQQTQNNATIVSWGPGSTGNRFDTRVSGNPRATVRTEVSGSGSESTRAIADGENWHHVAAVIPDNGAPTIGDVLFYIDGELDSLAVTGNTPLDTLATLNVRIGASRALANRTLTGKLDDIRIYDTALTAEEVLALVEGGDAPLQITSVVRNSDGSATIQWNARDGAFYTVLYSTDLQNWFELTDDADGGSYLDLFEAPGQDELYYRLFETE